MSMRSCIWVFASVIKSRKKYILSLTNFIEKYNNIYDLNMMDVFDRSISGIWFRPAKQSSARLVYKL